LPTKADLRDWLLLALRAHGGKASIVQICRHIWQHHEEDLRRSGDLFFTWQYDVRWAATQLRNEGVLRARDLSARGLWELDDSS